MGRPAPAATRFGPRNRERHRSLASCLRVGRVLSFGTWAYSFQACAWERTPQTAWNMLSGVVRCQLPFRTCPSRFIRWKTLQMVYSPCRNAGRLLILGSPGTGHPAAGLPPFELKTTFIKPQPHGPHFRFSPNGGDSKKGRGAVDFGNPQNRWRPLLSRQSSSRALTSAARQERCQLPEKDVGRVPRSSEGFPKAHANMGGGSQIGDQTTI